MKNVVHYSLDIEKRVLGALMLIGKHQDIRVQNSMLDLTDDSFYFPDCKYIFEIVKTNCIAGRAFDFVSLMPLVKPDCSEFFEIIRDEYHTGNYLAQDIESLSSYRTLRKQTEILRIAMKQVDSELLPELAISIYADAIKQISATIRAANDNAVRNYETILDEQLRADDSDSGTILTTIPGLPAVPERSLITIAGRSGHGKTFFALYLLDSIIQAIPGTHSLYFNLEMHEKNMLDRHSILLGAKGDSPKQRMANVSHILLTRNISLISLPMITIEEIEMYCRVEANRQKLGVVVVDYLGLVTSKTKHSRKDLEQNDIAKRLAALSIELDCIVITLIQVNREYKNRQVGQRCPVPSDAAEAMGSVHSASWWLGIDQPYLDDNEPEYLGLFQVQNRKNRYDSGLFKLEFDFLDGLFLPRTQPFCNRYSGKKENTSWIP